MTAARTAAALAVALAALAAAAPGRAPEATVTSFPGPPQPDPGTDAAPARSGRVVAFASSMRVNGSRYDPAATPTVFLWERRTGTLRQVTASGPSDQPSAENGTAWVAVGTATEKSVFSRSIVAFRSTADLTGGNPDGSAEIFVWDSLGGGITQITSATTGASSDPVLGARFQAERDAKGLYTGNLLVRYRVAFLSTSDLAGDNPDGLRQVFLYDSGRLPVERLVQVSHSTTGGAGPPAIDGNGDRIAFLHDGGLLPDDAPGTPLVYSFDRSRGLRSVTSFENPEDVAIDSSGRYVAYSAPVGVPKRSIVAVNARTGSIRVVVTNPGLGLRAPSLGRSWNRMAFLQEETDPVVVPDNPWFVHMLERDRILRTHSVKVAIPGPIYGPPRLLAGRPTVFFTSDGDLDGSNAAGRTVLFEADIRH